MKYDILVNKQNPIDESVMRNISLVFVKNYRGEDIMIEKECYEAYLKFSAYLLRKKIVISPVCAYRNIDQQAKIYNDALALHSPEYVEETIARPGYSEHHTGLAVDIALYVDGKYIIDDEEFVMQKKAIKKITKKCHKFGFIIRYPEAKDKITGYIYEPWHLRYVGEKAAKMIYKKELTLEEYLQKIAQ